MRDTLMMYSAHKFLRWLTLSVALAFGYCSTALASVTFTFNIIQEGGDTLCGNWCSTTDFRLRPFLASINFSESAVLAGHAGPQDIVDFTFTGGDIDFSLARLSGLGPYTIFFSPDRSSITAFESYRDIAGVGPVPVDVWQFNTTDCISCAELGGHMSAHMLEDGVLFRDGILSPSAWASGSWQSETVIPIPAALWLFVSGLLGLVGMARRKKAA
jgi:hypothetical protein